jgi:hypothetical protein
VHHRDVDRKGRSELDHGGGKKLGVAVLDIVVFVRILVFAPSYREVIVLVEQQDLIIHDVIGLSANSRALPRRCDGGPCCL